MNYYPFHIGDYLAATRHLSWEEDAAFRRLLDTYYTTEKPLPADLRQVCRLVLATAESQRQAVETVLGEFFQLTEFGWVNGRADREITEMQDRQLVAKVKANKRWDKHRAELSKATAMLQHEEIDAAALENDADAMLPTPTPTPTPITAKAVVERVPRKKAQVALPDDFSPNEVGELKAKDRGVDVATELEKFRNYHQAKASVMADWQAAWRTWIGNARPSMAPVASGIKRGSDDYAKLHKSAKWWSDAGFESVWNAMDAGCYHDTSTRFVGGKKLAVPA